MGATSEIQGSLTRGGSDPRPAFVRILQDVALTLLGLFVGAMLVIGVVFVGYWESLDPDSFLDWFAAHAGRIGGVMVPLGVGATIATAASAVGTWGAGRSARAWSLLSAVLATLVVIVYLAVHAPINAAFAAHAMPPERVAGELAIWARWHWMRVLLGLGAFWAQLCTVRSGFPSSARSIAERGGDA
jgi:hypothetical protein